MGRRQLVGERERELPDRLRTSGRERGEEALRRFAYDAETALSLAIFADARFDKYSIVVFESRPPPGLSFFGAALVGGDSTE